MSENSTRDEIPPGTLYMLILKTLARGGEMHGFEIANGCAGISELDQPQGDRLPISLPHSSNAELCNLDGGVKAPNLESGQRLCGEAVVFCRR